MLHSGSLKCLVWVDLQLSGIDIKYLNMDMPEPSACSVFKTCLRNQRSVLHYTQVTLQKVLMENIKVQ